MAGVAAVVVSAVCVRTGTQPDVQGAEDPPDRDKEWIQMLHDSSVREASGHTWGPGDPEPASTVGSDLGLGPFGSSSTIH
jgi:hypothetical protein